MKQLIDVAIIGAGPYGLSVAAHLGARGVNYRIFGKPMDTWNAHMPKGMTLKSEGFASSLSSPARDSRIENFFAKHGIPFADQGIPVQLADYLAYTAHFRARFVPNVEEGMVTGLERASDHFMLTLDSGEFVFARNVVMAVGVTWFAYTPDVLAQLPSASVSHTYEHRDVSQFKGREVAIVGSGSSAIDTAHALQDAGASVRLIARAPKLSYTSNPDPSEKLIDWLRHPSTTIGRGWGSFISAEAPLLFYRLPRHLKDRVIASHMHPAAGWFMREHVEGRMPVSLGCALAKAQAKDGRVALTLADANGQEETLGFDHIVAATGYRVDMGKVPFLSTGLRDAIAPNGGSPEVSDSFETAVSGLYATGLTAMETFGPLMRFMVGSEFAAPRLASHLVRKVSRSGLRQAA
ncbi:MAG TPA: NAD(P)/FAD-dependent oxidoreductase [Rhizomicrobium sp.]|jgi:cation diffusion facilitator CzcD-associated flavoprotein CzcO